ncbi:hypothetical protein [Desertibacillus haloalkaliphilus]|nr:hypothetical protein [Desertibacillus haloalkaliphilus]
MAIFWLIAFALLMSTLFAIERKLTRINQQNEQMIELLKGKQDRD